MFIEVECYEGKYFGKEEPAVWNVTININHITSFEITSYHVNNVLTWGTLVSFTNGQEHYLTTLYSVFCGQVKNV